MELQLQQYLAFFFMKEITSCIYLASQTHCLTTYHDIFVVVERTLRNSVNDVCSRRETSNLCFGEMMCRVRSIQLYYNDHFVNVPVDHLVGGSCLPFPTVRPTSLTAADARIPFLHMIHSQLFKCRTLQMQVHLKVYPMQ